MGSSRGVTDGVPIAVTGADAVQLLVVGGLLVAAGTVVLTARRRASA